MTSTTTPVKKKNVKKVKQFVKHTFSGFSDELFSNFIPESMNGHRFNIDAYSHTMLR